MLETDGGELVLRRAGGNPFHDEVLDALVGQRIHGVGELRGNVAILDSWTEAKEPGEPGPGAKAGPGGKKKS